MDKFVAGWRIQTRVLGALMIRELTTRFGRENIGFLWIMVEPLLFAVLVGLVWRFMKGPEEHGVSVIGFVVSGYIPMVMFRNSVNRSIGSFNANGSLMYHRQIKILDLIFVRFLVEFIGHLMAYAFIGTILIWLDVFPLPKNLGLFFLGFSIYSIFSLSVCLIVAPLSEMSEVLEKFMPVTTYIMIPFSGTFNMASWLTNDAREVVLYSPPVHGMEMMRGAIFGHRVTPYFDFLYPLAVSMILMAIGLFLCRRVRKTLVVE